MGQALDQLVDKLKTAFGDRLKSVVLYGSSAAPGDSDRFSDQNVLCVLSELTPRELANAEAVLRWWRSKGNPSPLLLAEDELSSSSWCFPIEFHDLKERRRVLYGSDPMDGIEVDTAYHLAHVARELRAKVIRLRQMSAGLASDRSGLLRLLADSVSTFCVLGRHALLANGQPAAFGRREVVAQLKDQFGLAPEPFHALLDVREGRPPALQIDPMRLLGDYLTQLRLLVAAVDASSVRNTHL